MLPEVFELMRRASWTAKFVTELDGEKYYTVAFDGSEYFHSTKIECPGCLRRTSKDGETQYSHVVVGARLVRAGSRAVLPLDVEEVRNEDGRDKQDCEINAGKRMAKRLREEHRQLKICLTGDDLYAHEPFILNLRELRINQAGEALVNFVEVWERNKKLTFFCPVERTEILSVLSLEQMIALYRQQDWLL